jgi:hypothetical protein
LQFAKVSDMIEIVGRFAYWNLAQNS